MHKLGYGSYSTVWLAQRVENDETSATWVVVKVTDSVMLSLDDYKMSVMLTKSVDDQTFSLPSYLVALICLHEYYNKITSSNFPHTVILDFGGAHVVGSWPTYFQSSKECIAAEVVFTNVIQEAGDPPRSQQLIYWQLARRSTKYFLDPRFSMEPEYWAA
ncbi:hypothetical protein CPB84DRAFT_313836 [Gymnopilus junonius]|uniref:Protein kinase domain-containing protein n=1 Tax=Gymnopilus junonius TaxID=109634 RepID=A0A9P5NE14_GYMJU|nr:hypothetical protein CPB84DRAFT_313836 [Gymnopilus junonius]